MKRPTLEQALEGWQVHAPDTHGNFASSYWAVSNAQGIIAYFLFESDAYRFRLSEVNRTVNG